MLRSFTTLLRFWGRFGKKSEQIGLSDNTGLGLSVGMGEGGGGWGGGLFLSFRVVCIPNLGVLHSLEPLEKFLVVGGGWWVVGGGGV